MHDPRPLSMTTSELTPNAPWHDAPGCPRCGLLVATPARFSSHHGTEVAPELLWCPACGHDWTESDWQLVAQAWWSRGAWDAMERLTADGNR